MDTANTSADRCGYPCVREHCDDCYQAAAYAIVHSHQLSSGTCSCGQAVPGPDEQAWHLAHLLTSLRQDTAYDVKTIQAQEAAAARERVYQVLDALSYEHKVDPDGCECEGCEEAGWLLAAAQGDSAYLRHEGVFLTKRETAGHNHLTRDVKKQGQCPACDLYWKRHGTQ